MKVGLLTFHSAHNYGAVLQAYATQETIKRLGVEIDCIDYRPNYLIKQRVFPNLKKQSAITKLKLIFWSFILILWKYKRNKGFNDFIESKLHLSKENYLFPKFKNEYEAYVIGSDQVWNVKLTKGFDDAYWGNFNTKKDAIKISYAASMSNYNLDVTQKEQMLTLLKNFNFISVREDEAKEFIYKNFNKEATTVLDPTFLLDKSKWKKISTPPSLNKKYILVYSIGLRDEALTIANSLAKQLDAVVIELTMMVDKNAILNKYQSTSPEMFLGFFENAECIITTSFHGTSFSIIYNKPFYSIAHGNDKDNRQTTILKKLGLMDRFIDRNEKPVFQKINYREVNTKLNILREESITFLKKSLSI